MQETLRQYQQSPLSKNLECVDCHRGHRFAGATDASMIKEALRISACVSADLLRIELSNIGAAHNLPTGGIDRHLWLKVWRSSAPEGVHKAYIGRTFRPAEGGGKEVIKDNTISAGSAQWFVVARAALRGEPHEPIRVNLRYLAGPEKDQRLAPISWEVLETTIDETTLPLCTNELRPETALSPPAEKKPRR